MHFLPRVEEYRKQGHGNEKEGSVDFKVFHNSIDDTIIDMRSKQEWLLFRRKKCLIAKINKLMF